MTMVDDRKKQVEKGQRSYCLKPNGGVAEGGGVWSKLKQKKKVNAANKSLKV